MFLNGFDGLFKSSDGGVSWAQIETMPASIINAFDVSPEYRDDREVILSTYAGGVLVYRNIYGPSWDVLNKGLGYSAIRRTDIRFSPNYYRDQTLFATSNDSLLISRDRGQTWERKNLRDIRWLPGRIERLFGIGRFSRTKFGRPLTPTLIAVSPNYETDKTLFLATRANGVLRTTNEGKSFKTVWKKDSSVADSIVFSPKYLEDNIVFISSSTGSGLYRSLNSGDTWEEVGKGLSYGKNSVILAISPSFGTDKTLFAGTGQGVFKSTDMGEEWKKLRNPSDGSNYIDALAVSPNYEEDQEIIISVRGKGLFKSNNGGETFRQIGMDLIMNNHLLSLPQEFPERSVPIKYSPSYKFDRTIFGISGEMMSVSEDGGETWSVIKRPLRYENIRADVIRYHGENNWKNVYQPEQFSGHRLNASSVTSSNVSGSTAAYRFFGTGVCWIGTENADQGIANVYVNGALKSRVDTYRDAARTGARLFTIKNLPAGSHEIKIEVTGERCARASDCVVRIEAFDVFP
jgi:photosystem II stability/assembly factor-like uncharacterized protein